MTTTTWANTAKVELMTATHNFAATVSQSCAEHTNTVLDSIASTAGICVGAVASGTGITAGTVVSRITSNVALQKQSNMTLPFIQPIPIWMVSSEV